MSFANTIRAGVFFTLLAALLFVLTPSPAHAQEGKGIYDFETALLKFDVQEAHADKKRTVYIADWGNLQRVDEERSRFGEKYTITTIYHGNMAYRIDWEDETIKKYEAEEREPKKLGFKKLAESLGSEEAAIEQLQDKGFYVLPEEPILGYFCEYWKAYEGKFITYYWAYRGIALKKVVKERLVDDVDFFEQILAQKAQFNVYIDNELFELPEGFKETDTDRSDMESQQTSVPEIRLP